MDRLISSVFLLCLFVFSQSGNAQTKAASENLPEEIIRITPSDDLFVSGSNLYYQVLATFKDNSLSDFSKVAEVGLYNAKGERLAIQKVLLNNGTGNGRFFIESSLPSGEYFLLAATNWSMNNREHPKFAEQEFLLLNPFQRLPVSEAGDAIRVNFKAQAGGASAEEANNRKPFTLNTDKEKYGFREKVQLTIKNDAAFQTPFSISVERVKPLEIVKSPNELEVEVTQEQLFVPTIRGSLIQGSIAAKEGALSVANQPIALSIPGKQYVFKLDRTNSEGEFLFTLDEGEYSYKDINVYVVGADEEDFEVRLDPSVLDYIQPEREAAKLQVDEALKEWIEFKSTANQIENAYFETKTDSVAFPPVKDHFYTPLGVVYRLDDYTRFATVNETFIEIITSAALRKQGDNYIFKVYNYQDDVNTTGMAKLRPLVLIDGIFINDNAILAGYNSREIETITVVAGNYRYGPELFAGIIDVETKEGNYGDRSQLVDFEYLYPLLEAEYYQPQYSREDLSNIPDYRTLLLWDHDLNLKNKTTIKKEFYTSDLEGLYKVEVKGYDDAGEEAKAIYYFTVE